MKVLSLTALLLLSVAAAHGQQKKWELKAAVDDALTYANSVAYMHYIKPADYPKDRAFISYTGDTFGLEPCVKEERKRSDEMIWTRMGASKMTGEVLYVIDSSFPVIADNYYLLIPLDGGYAERTQNGIKFDVDSVYYNFEAGKYYSIDSRVDENGRITFSILETAQTEAAYRAYMEANPRLNGKWYGEKRANTIKYTMQYTIEGNRMVFEGTSRNKPFIAEGKILYNENTIVFIPETATANGNKPVDLSSRMPYIWYYTLTDDDLHLEGPRGIGNAGIRLFMSGLTTWHNEGEFRKINQ